MRVILADQALADETGHYLNAALALREALVVRGHSVEILGNVRASATFCLAHRIRPLFFFGFVPFDDRAVELLPPKMTRRIRAARRLTKAIPLRSWRHRTRAALFSKPVVDRVALDWADADMELRFTASDLVLINSADGRAAEGLLRWLVRIPVERRPQVTSILHYAPVMNAPSHASSQERWRRAFNGARQIEGIHFLADSPKLVESFAQLCGSHVGLVPIPHVISAETPSVPRAGPRIVLFLGVGTRTKGFHLLPEIIEDLRPEIEQRRFRFIVQVNLLDTSPEMERAVVALNRLPAALSDGPLTREAYYDLLRAADILLQPHDPEYYAVQTSGIFAEARGLGLVTILPARTLMAAEVARTGGGIVVSNRTALGYANAVRDATEHYDQLAFEAREAARQWAREHSPETFIGALNGVLPATHQL